ncbi:MAG TPA: caspase family protein [Pyrinomonadaceae bacterium]|nr:caspase family protein [Pyrinomonadaceae bacterium]
MATRKASTSKKASKTAAKGPALPPRRAPKRALCVGINDYPYDGSDLNGCVNDSRAWAELLISKYGFASSDVRVLNDAEANKKNVLAALKDLVAGARDGDVLVFQNSSHGSYVAEVGGDEPTYDEILCPYDIDANEIRDDELREIFAGVRSGVRLSVILDNCFSGTATRALIGEGMGMRTPDDRRRRFLSPALRGRRILENPWAARPKSEGKYPESKMNEVLLTGCTDREYSYDAYFNGVYHGAMTYYALQAIRQSNYKLTYAQLHSRLLNLITDYPQHPQLEGKKDNKRRQIFT